MKASKMKTMKTLITQEMKKYPYFYFSFSACASVVIDVAHANNLYLTNEQERALIDWMMYE